MIKRFCDDCRKPIDPKMDNYLSFPSFIVKHGNKMAQIGELYFCDKKHAISWLQKNSEPSSIISSLNPQGPAL